MPRSWDVTPHIITIRIRRLASVSRRVTSCPLAPSGETAPEIPRDYSRGSVFTNHSVAADSSGEELRAPSAPLPPRRDVHRPSLPPVLLRLSLLSLVPLAVCRSPSRLTVPLPRIRRVPQRCPLPRGARTCRGTRQIFRLVVGFDSFEAPSRVCSTC